jgi:hypothetical protein
LVSVTVSPSLATQTTFTRATKPKAVSFFKDTTTLFKYSAIWPTALASWPFGNLSHPTKGSSLNEKIWNTHGDNLLRHERKTYISVTITRTANESSIRKGRTRTKALAAVTHSEDVKRSHFKKIAETQGYELVPFGLETYGGLGPDASKFLLMLSKIQRHTTAQLWLQHGMGAVFGRRVSIGESFVHVLSAEPHLHDLISSTPIDCFYL